MKRIALCQKIVIGAVCWMTTITAVIPAIDVICNTVVADPVAARITVDCQTWSYLKQNAQTKSKA